MRPFPALLTAVAALVLSLIPAAAPAAPAAVPGSMNGNFELVLHAKTFPMNGEKPFLEKLTASVVISDANPQGLSSITMAGTLNGLPFVLTGYRIGKHFLMFQQAGSVVVSLSGDAVVPKTTGVAKTFKGRGTLANLTAMSDFTFSAKRVGP
jgi:23S rRNA U2552 (ribose-2'-O)-methylase RlmE/FtsJ